MFALDLEHGLGFVVIDYDLALLGVYQVRTVGSECL